MIISLRQDYYLDWLWYKYPFEYIIKNMVGIYMGELIDGLLIYTVVVAAVRCVMVWQYGATVR